jgi:hypothetical protein
MLEVLTGSIIKVMMEAVHASETVSNTRLHDITSKKTAIFVFIAMRT